MSTPFPDAAATWNKRFSGDDFLFGREPNAYLVASAHHLPAGGRVLCVADGEGRNSVWLAQQGFQVDAFDIADAGVAKARQLAAAAGVQVQFEVADGDTRAWPADTYDAVVAVFVQFADPDQRTRLFKHMVTTLKPGGTLLLQGYTPRQLDYKTGGPPILSHLYTEDLLREAFAGLHIVELRSYEADIHEGSGHHGRSALVGLVARKAGVA
jgi:SAM-dependent methyltransferase